MSEMTLALVIFLFPLAYSPGPGNMFFAACGARFGFRATLPASAGYHLATWVVTVAIGLGLVTTLQTAPGLFQALKLAGAAYVLWIAARFLGAGVASTTPDARPAARAATFRDGAVLLLLNPKAYVIIALMFTQFLDDDTGAALIPVIAITSIFTLTNLVAFSLWSGAGARVARVFARAGSARALNVTFAAILALLALWMVLA